MVVDSPREVFKYDAFISYSWVPDKRLASYLQKAVHGFARPWYRRRSVRIFLDVTGLTTPEAWIGIQAALKSSRHLILLASPGAVESGWVDRELAYWRSLNRRPPTIVLTEGEIHWSKDGNDFDWTSTTAIPKVLSKAYSEEPLHWDAKEATTALSPRNPNLQQIAAAIYAELTGRELYDVIGDDVRAHRRNIAYAIAAVAFTTTAVGVAAYVQSQRAIQQRLVIAHKLRAESDLLEVLRRDQLHNSALLAADALRGFQALGVWSIEADQALRARVALVSTPTPLGKTQWRPYLVSSSSTTGIQFVGTESQQGCSPTTGGDPACSGELCVVKSPAALVTCLKMDFPVRSVLADDPRLLTWGGADRICTGFYAAATGVTTTYCSRLPSRLVRITGVASGKVLLTTEQHVCELEGARIGRELNCQTLPADHGKELSSPSGRFVATLKNERTCLFSVSEWLGRDRIPKCSGGAFASDVAAVDDDGKWVLAQTTGRTLRRVDQIGQIKWSVAMPATIKHVVVSPQSRMVAVVSWDFRSNDNRISVLDLESGEVLASLRHQGRISGASFSRDGRRLLSTSGDYMPSDKTASVWDPRTGEELRRLVHTDDVSVGSFVSDGGDTVLTVTAAGLVQSWPTERSDYAEPTRLGERVRLLALNSSGDLAIAGSSRICLRQAATGKESCWSAADPAAVSISAPGRLTYVAGNKLCQLTAGVADAQCFDLKSVSQVALSSTRPLVAQMKEEGLCVGSFSTTGVLTQSSCRTFGSRGNVSAMSDNGVAVAVEGESADTRQIVVQGETRRPLPISRPAGGIAYEAFSGQGDLYAYTDDGIPDGSTVRVVSTVNGALVWSRRLPARVLSLAFSSNGRYLATGTASGRGDVHVWDWKSDTEVARLPHRLPVTSIAFSEDGRTLYSASNEQVEFESRWRSWSVGYQTLLTVTCDRLLPLVVAGSRTIDLQRFSASAFRADCESTLRMN